MQEILANENVADFRIGIVQSRFNEDVVAGLLNACLKGLASAGVSDHNNWLIKVPGALEVPLTLSVMADTGRYDGLIALGAVIRGDTYHFEVVSNESARGITEVQIISGVPVANAILTTDNDDQALARTAVKGREAAEVVVEMIGSLRAIRQG